MERVIRELREMADALDKVAVDVGISKATGGGASIAGSAMAIGGLLLAPFSGGASLTLTVGGLALGTAGGVTSLGAALAQHFTDKDRLKTAKAKNSEAIDLTNLFREVLQAYLKALKEFQEFLENEIKKQNDIKDNTVRAGTTIKGAYNVVSTGLAVTEVITFYKEVRAITAITGNTGAKAVKMLAGTSTQLAKEMSAPGLKVFSKTVVTAGGTGAKVLSASLGVFGIGMGIWDCIDGANNIKNGSEHAKMFRESANSLEKAKDEIIEMYKELTSA